MINVYFGNLMFLKRTIIVTFSKISILTLISNTKCLYPLVQFELKVLKTFHKHPNQFTLIF